jgi:uncharacterized membrane protein
MYKTKIITALGAVVALGIGSQAFAEAAHMKSVEAQTAKTLTAQMPQGFEKCYGIARAGKNDCGSATEACSAQSTTDGAKNAWIGVPEGTCSKIVGGSTTAGSAT